MSETRRCVYDGCYLEQVRVDLIRVRIAGPMIMSGYSTKVRSGRLLPRIRAQECAWSSTGDRRRHQPRLKIACQVLDLHPGHRMVRDLPRLGLADATQPLSPPPSSRAGYESPRALRTLPDDARDAPMLRGSSS